LNPLNPLNPLKPTTIDRIPELCLRTPERTAPPESEVFNRYDRLSAEALHL